MGFKCNNLMSLYAMICVAIFAATVIFRMLNTEKYFQDLNTKNCIIEHYYVFFPFLIISLAYIMYVMVFTYNQTKTVKNNGQWDSKKMVVESKKVSFGHLNKHIAS